MAIIHSVNSVLKYAKYEYKNALLGKDSYQYIQLPYFNNTSTRSIGKILFVLDYVPQEDLRSGRLLSGDSGAVLFSMLDYITNKLMPGTEFSWMACTYNACRTIGKTKEFQSVAKAVFTERILDIIDRYKPDVVVAFGDDPIKGLLSSYITKSMGKLSPWYGIPLALRTKKHICKIVPTISINKLVQGTSASAGILGYVIRNLVNAIQGENPYKVNNKRLYASETKLITNIFEFKKLLTHIQKAPVVAIDTETKDLSRVTNSVLTIQFATSDSVGYVLPFYHKDTPFDPGELRYIKNKLGRYFEGNNDCLYHVYTNAVFDLNVLRKELELDYMHNDVWDILAGEYGHDENLKFLSDVTGEYYYSLGNLAPQYGFNGYFEAEFSKADRSNISKVDLDEKVLRYMSYDVCVPFSIHGKQIQRAIANGHSLYETLIRKQFSDQIHLFSKMENSGSKIDVSYLFYLRTPDNPIEKEIRSIEHQLLNTDAAKKANSILMKGRDVPRKGLFGDTNIQVLSLSDNKHKQLLFFDVLKLEPLETGVSGSGKLDKNFQKKYENVPEVSLYNKLGKAKKLRNAYVKSFIQQLASDADFRSDHVIRASYRMLEIITGRTAARNPNLQQIPSRSELGKLIKRLFIAIDGTLYIKVDYRVHEVRGWGIISFDHAIADLFINAKKLRDKYRIRPNEELKKRLDTEADIHIMNASYFFSVAIDFFMNLGKDKKIADEIKQLRDAVKGVIFGLIYQMSIRSLATTIKKPVKFAEKLVSNFRKRFPTGMKWIEDTKKKAKNQLFIENPLGFRRHLWGYLFPESCSFSNRVHAEMSRRAVNSPIQGMCSQFMAIGGRDLDRQIHDFQVKTKKKIKHKICNTVHDSLESLFEYRYFLLGLALIEESLTDNVRKIVNDRYGWDFVVDLEIDFEIGPSLSDLKKWDFSLAALENIVYKSLVFQKEELGHKINISQVMEIIFVDGWEYAPAWMKTQAKNIGWRFDAQKYRTKDKGNLLCT